MLLKHPHRLWWMSIVSDQVDKWQHSLKPANERRVWSGTMSVCVVPGTGNILVFQWEDKEIPGCNEDELKSVDVFSADGHQIHHSLLPYRLQTGPHNTCANRYHVFAIESGSTRLHVHRADTGEHIHVLTREHMKCAEEWETILQVSYGGDGYLHVLVGCMEAERWDLKLVTYKVTYEYSG